MALHNKASNEDWEQSQLCYVFDLVKTTVNSNTARKEWRRIEKFAGVADTVPHSLSRGNDKMEVGV